jgi:hypothetical protein
VQQCSIWNDEDDTDYPGNDITKYNGINNENDCRKLCLDTQNCQLALFGKGGQAWSQFGNKPCLLKSAAGERKDFRNLVALKLSKADRPNSQICSINPVSVPQSAIFALVYISPLSMLSWAYGQTF